MAKGDSPAETLAAMIKDLNEIADYRDKLEDNVRLILKEGTEDDLRQYVEEANKNLEQYNARKITITDFQYELLRRRVKR